VLHFCIYLCFFKDIFKITPKSIQHCGTKAGGGGRRRGGGVMDRARVRVRVILGRVRVILLMVRVILLGVRVISLGLF